MGGRIRLESVATLVWNTQAERQVAEITRQYKELEEQTDAELKDAAIIIEKRESEIVDLKYRLAITEEKLDSARRDAEQHEKEAFRLQTKLGEMKGVESLIARLEALEEKAANDKLGV
ncbi:hypothetical protein AWH63_20050 [Marinobacter sp. C18]|nr:hypothetical protein AWH63_20050 [Marinobacter sp. C18]